MRAPSLRPFEGRDAGAIAKIYGEAVLTGSASFETEPPGQAEMARRMAALVEAGHPVLVAEQDGAVLGFASAGPYRTRPAYRFTVEDSVYVAAAARGRGTGGLLLERLLRDAQARGFRQMVAVIGDSANTASIALHLSLGFTLTGTLSAVGWKHGRWLDSILMQRALGVGAGAPAD